MCRTRTRRRLMPVHFSTQIVAGGIPTPSCDNISSGGRKTFSFTNASIGSVRVTATLPVGVAVRHKHSTVDDMAYNGIVSGTTAAYLPSLFKNYYSTWYSSYQVQETTGNPFMCIYTITPPSPPYYYKEIDLAARGHKEVYLGNEPLPNGWRGSARVVVMTGSGQVATAIQHAGSAIGMGYHGFRAGARDLTMPILIRDTDWQASLTVQNVGTVSTNVTVRFYSLSGAQVGDPVDIPGGLAKWYSYEMYSQIPNPFEGSVQVSSASADIVAAVHEAHTAGRGYGYSVP